MLHYQAVWIYNNTKCICNFFVEYIIPKKWQPPIVSLITSSWSLLQQSLIRDATQTPFLPWYVYEQSPDKNLVPTFFCVHRAFWSSDFWSVVIKFSQVCLKQYSRITRMPFVWSLNTFLIFNLIMTNEPRGLFVMTIYAE